MKLYCHPISTTSRPVLLFAAEAGIPLEITFVDLFAGENHQPEFEAINPNRLIPVLEDGNFRLTESSAILRYLADKVGAAQYPKDLQARARVNERLDWVNTQLSRELCYGVVYPQIFEFMKKRSAEAQAAHIEWGTQKAQSWLRVMNDALLGPDNPYLCGAAITIADYLAASYVALGELTGSDFEAYPNVKRWLDRMKALKSWDQVYETVNGFGKTLDKRSMVAA